MDATKTSFNEQHESSYTEMVFDAAGPDFMTQTLDEEPNPEYKKFFDVLEAAYRELWPGCKKVTQLYVVARLLNIKSEYCIHEQCFDSICQLIMYGLPEDNTMVDSLYESKKIIQALGLPAVFVDCCRFRCMLYWNGDKNLDQCKFREAQRYKKSRKPSKSSSVPFTRMHHLPPTPRLKRLYASQETTPYMRWHAKDHGHDLRVMCHPSDSEAWKHFDAIYPPFAPREA